MMRTLMVLAVLAAAALACGADAKARRPAAKPKPAAAPSTVLHISSHLAENAQVSVDGKPAITVGGYGSSVTPIAAGHHTLSVTSSDGVSYRGALDLAAGDVMTAKGKGYWCVNLLETQLEPYSKDECAEDVNDAG